MGETYVFSIYHLVQVDSLCETARIVHLSIGGKA